MAQFRSLGIVLILIAATLILPSLALPFDTRGSNALLLRDYHDVLVERDTVEPLVTREDVDLEARSLKGFKNFFTKIGRFISKIFRRELDDADTLSSRDHSYGELD